MSNGSYAMMAGACTDEDIPLIREMLVYDAISPGCCDLKRGTRGVLEYNTVPSSLHWSRQAEWPWAIREADLQPHHEVLEVGGGGCVMKYPVAKRVKRVVVVDTDEKDMRYVRNSISVLGFDNIVQVLDDARFLPFPDDWFDSVFCVSVIEHMPTEHELAIDEMIRVLKPGRPLLLTMDVAVDGCGNGNFYVDKKIASEILAMLGIDKVAGTDGDILGSYLSTEKTSIVVMMAKYVKPVSTALSSF